MNTEDIKNLKEEKIRTFLKTLTVMDIANSVYLYGIDFETCEISEVVNSIYSLFCEVKTLERMVENDFKSEDHGKALLPSSKETKSVVIQDYSRKCSALNKILNCPELLEMFRDRIVDTVLASSESKVRK